MSMYEVTARIVSPGRSEISAKASTISFDSSPGTGDELPGPAELLCSALAACLLKNIERFTELLAFDQQGAEVLVTAEREDAPPRFTRLTWELRLMTTESDQRIALLSRNLQKHGTVYNTLRAACEIDGNIVRAD